MLAAVARSLIALSFLSAAAPLAAQRADSALTVERIFLPAPRAIHGA